MKKGIIGTIIAMFGIIAIAILTGRIMNKEIVKNRNMSDKHLSLFLLMNKWVEVKQEGKHLKKYFEDKHYKKIAVYGMSYAGERLVEELKDSGIQILYGIDRNANAIYADIDIVSVDDELKSVDAIVVTAISFYEEIEETLFGKTNCPIISLEDILYEI